MGRKGIQLQQTAQQIDDGSSRIEVAEMLCNTKTCLTCGKKLTRGHGYKRARGYCDISCYYQKPPMMAYIEHIYDKPVKEVIIENLKHNDNIAITSDLLGITRQTLSKWIKKLGIKRVVEWR